MAIARRFLIDHRSVFPSGAYLKGTVEPVPDFNAPAREDGSRPQQLDRDTGLPLWQCVVIDGDESASRREVGVTVKFVTAQRPVPPKNSTPFPWTPVEFTGLSALPYIEEGGKRGRIAWSFRAEGMTVPSRATVSDSKDVA